MLRGGDVVAVAALEPMHGYLDGKADVLSVEGERAQLFVRETKRSDWYELHPTDGGWIARPNNGRPALSVRRA